MDNEETLKSKKKKSSCLAISIISIVGILLLFIAIPNFLRFSARAVDSEAKQNLGAIYTAYYSYHADNNTYPSQPFIILKGATFNCLQIADWEPKGTTRYNYNCVDTIVFTPTEDRYPGCTACPKEKIYTHTDQTSFTVAACANIESDKFCNGWTIDDSKHLRHISDGYTHNKKFKVKNFIRLHFTHSKKIMDLVDYLFQIGTWK